MNSLYTSKKSGYKVSFIVILTVVVLSFCLLVGSVIAWFTQTYNYNNTDNVIGSVEMKIYRNNEEIVGTVSEIDGVTKWRANVPFQITGDTLTRSDIGLTMRNVGTIDALVRATINIYYLDDYSSPQSNTNKRSAILVNSTPTEHGTIKLTTSNWVYDLAGNNNVAVGYLFYSTPLSPYVIKQPNAGNTGFEDVVRPANNVDIIDSFEVSQSQKNTVFYIDITIDAVAYDGNIYKKIENGQTDIDNIPVYALPFGTKESLPDSWEAWK